MTTLTSLTATTGCATTRPRAPLAARLMRAALLLALVGLLGACGASGVRGAAFEVVPLRGPVGPAPADRAELAERAGGSASTGPEALVQSASMRLLGDVQGGFELLLQPFDEWHEGTVGVARLLALLEVAPQVDPTGERIAAWLAAEGLNGVHPLETVLRHELAALAAVRQAIANDDAQLPDLGRLGQPTLWRGAGSWSTSPWMDLDRPFAPEQVRSLAELPEDPRRVVGLVPTRGGRVHRLLGTRESLTYLEAFLETRDELDVAVYVSYPGAWRLLVDGTEVARRSVDEPDSPSTQIHRVRLRPGVHRVLFKAGGADGADVAVRLVPLSGSIVRFDAEPGAWRPDGVRAVSGGTGSVADLFAIEPETPADWLVAASLAGWAGDHDLSRRLLTLHRDVRHPLLVVRRVTLARSLERLPTSQRETLALQLLRELDDRWLPLPGVDALALQMLYQAGRGQEARQRLERALAAAPDSRLTVLALSAAYGEEGWSSLMEQLLQRIAHQDEVPCSVAGSMVRLRRARGVRTTAAELPAPWLRCDDVRLAIVEDELAPAGRYGEAADVMRRMVARSPDSGTGYSMWIAFAEAAGDDEQAEAALAMARRHGFTTADLAMLRADRALATDSVTGSVTDSVTDSALDSATGPATGMASGMASGRAAASALLEERRRLNPWSVDAHLAADYLAGQPTLAELRSDGLAAIRRYDRLRAAGEIPDDLTGAAIGVHDYAVWRFFPDGSAITVTHLVVELTTREAIEAWGEVGPGQGQTVLNVRTIKRDGRMLAPEDIAGKDSISLPHLEIGDFVELEFVRAVPPTVHPDDGVSSDRFFFQTDHLPLVESTVRYIVPDSLVDRVQLDLRNFTGDQDRRRIDGDTWFTFTARMAPTPQPEPSMPPGVEWLPSVRLGIGVVWDTWLRAYGERVRPATRASAEIREATRELLRGVRGTRDRAHRIFRFVNDDVAADGGFFHTDATSTLSLADGDRLALMMAMLDAAGIEHELVFVRARDADQHPLVIPDITHYAFAALRISDGRQSWWADPTIDEAPFDYLDPDVQGVPGLVMTGPRAGTALTTPTWPATVERRVLTLEAQLTADGSARATIVEVEPLSSAPDTRQFLQYLDSQRELLQLVEQLYASDLPGAVVDTVAIEPLDDPDAPLTHTVSLTIEGWFERIGDGLVLDRPLLPERPLATLAALAERRTTLVPRRGVNSELVVTLHAPDGLRFVDPPADASATDGPRHYTRTTTLLDGGRTLRLHRELFIPALRIEPDAYPSFVTFVRDIQRHEQIRLRLQPTR